MLLVVCWDDVSDYVVDGIVESGVGLQYCVYCILCFEYFLVVDVFDCEYVCDEFVLVDFEFCVWQVQYCDVIVVVYVVDYGGEGGCGVVYFEIDVEVFVYVECLLCFVDVMDGDVYDLIGFYVQCYF